MTKRNIRDRVEKLEGDADGDTQRVVIKETVVGSGWDDGDCDEYPDEGERHTCEKVIELGGN